MTLIGISILLLVAYEVYSTILDVRARAGPISEVLNRSLWYLFSSIAFRLPRKARHKFLNIIGPILLPLLIVILIALLVLAFAFIYFPRMPEHFNISSDRASSLWIEAFYFSGITLATVGYGDITPVTTEMRLVAMVEGALGFTFIPLAITYLLTVYGALTRKRMLALSFYHRGEGSPNVAGFIIHHFVSGRFYGLDSSLRSITRDLQEQLEAHIEHPVIHFFHPTQVYKGLPRVLFLALETCAVIQSCLDKKSYPEGRDHPEVLTLNDCARHILIQLLVSLRLDKQVKQPTRLNINSIERWHNRFLSTIEQLDRAGIKIQDDKDTAWREYQLRREEWETCLYIVARYLGYDWDEVAGDISL
jgi:hypothetical protein